MSGQSLRTSPIERSEPIERAGLDELRALQSVRLKQALTRSALVPQYRKKFAEAGVSASDLKHPDDLKGFPFTTKEDLRQNYPFGMFAVPMSEIVRIHASSGTTGKPTVVGYTRGDIALWSALMARSIRAAGGRPGDKMHVAYGYGLFTGGLGFHYGAEHLGCTVIPVSSGEIERRMHLNALNVYGLSEVIGPGVAQEYGDTKDSLTIWEDHFYPEIIDPETGEVLPDGAEGELVLTSLSKEAMPVIRYRTRDLTRLLPGNGRAMHRMDRIKGRSDDMLIIRGVNVFPSQIEAALAQEEAFAPHYILEVTRPGRLDELEIIVETRTAVATDAAAQLANHAMHHIKSQVGVTAKVRAVAPGSIERSQGKAKRVIDKRPR